MRLLNKKFARKTAAAALTAAVLRAAGFVTGLYRAGCEPLEQRVRINGEAVADALLCAAAETLSRAKPLPRAAAELAAAAACFVGISDGRSFKESFPTPIPIAPDETRITSLPAFFKSLNTLQSSSTPNITTPWRKFCLRGLTFRIRSAIKT